MIRVDLRELLDHLRLVAMVRRRMMRLGNADFRIRSTADLPGHHERDDARQIAAVREQLQVEHQSGVIGVGGGHTGGLVEGRQLPGALLLRLLDAPLDVANRLEVLGQSGAVARPEIVLKIGDPLAQ